MPSLGKAVLKGKSGKAYQFQVYPWGTRFRKMSGVYVVASRSRRVNGGLQLVPLFVGQNENLSRPFEKHRRAAEFLQHGANCVCLQANGSENSRVETKHDLVDALDPVCNRPDGAAHNG